MSLRDDLEAIGKRYGLSSYGLGMTAVEDAARIALEAAIAAAPERCAKARDGRDADGGCLECRVVQRLRALLAEVVE